MLWAYCIREEMQEKQFDAIVNVTEVLWSFITH